MRILDKAKTAQFAEEMHLDGAARFKKSGFFRKTVIASVAMAMGICGVGLSVAMADPSEHQAFTSGPTRAARATLSVQAGESLIAVLVRAGASREDAMLAARGIRSQFSDRDLRPGDAVTVFLVQSGNESRLVGFNLASGATQSLTVTRSVDNSFRARALTTNMERRTLRVAGTVGENGLVSSVREQGAPERAADSLANAFAFDVDFEREVGPGTQFELMYDRVGDARGLVVRDGEPVFASLTTTTGRTMSLYRFLAPGESEPAWYDASGNAARRNLMRTPINGARLTSSYGMRRHPISGFTRLHAGIDFGAPIGTPILSAGDGVVVRAGWMGGYGNVVDIDHGGGITTRYGHTSRFAAGLSVGDHVSQGQVIAYVGTTGRSTGPHLHYEIHVNGNPINPATANVSRARQLSGSGLVAFQAARSRVDSSRREAISATAMAGGGGSASAATH